MPTDLKPTTGEPAARRSIPEWAWMTLLAVLVFGVWWRGHTFGPTVEDRVGVQLWPVIEGEAEPLDCDEAAYAYIGRRVNDGAVLYRDLTENKPPLGYWLYALAARIGDADELTVRVMPIPIVLATVALIWWLGIRLAGPASGCLAAFLFAILSADPYLFGNGANLEHAMNLLAVAALAALVWAWPGGSRRRPAIAAAGLLIGAEALIKQVAVVHAPLFAVALWLRRDPSGAARPRAARLLDVLALAAGFALPWAAAVGVLLAQGAGRAAYEDIILYARALVTETPPAPNAPNPLIRWLTGNSNPNNGALPWPFGKTDWVSWWGTGSWPIWLASVPALARLLAGPRTTGPRRLAAAWTLSAWVQVVLPGLYWQHYYLLPTPGVALAVAILAADAAGLARTALRDRRPVRAALPGAALVAAVAAVAGTAVIQVRDYLLVPPTELTRYKGGYQWVRLRQIGRELAIRKRIWDSPQLYVWGWQSPLYLYSGMDSPSRHFFANELLKAQAARRGSTPDPLVGAWLEEILADLRADPPELIFTGDPPFPALLAFLRANYVGSRLVPEAPVLWVLAGDGRRFERAGSEAMMRRRALMRVVPVSPSPLFQVPRREPEFPKSRVFGPPDEGGPGSESSGQ